MTREQRQPFHHSRASMGNIVHLAGALAPLVIDDFVKDPMKKWPPYHGGDCGGVGVCVADGVRDSQERDGSIDRL